MDKVYAFVAPKLIGGREAKTPVEGEGFAELSEAAELTRLEEETGVVLPELRPSIFAGFLLAFTMSADDFIITHFTKGAGVDTLTTEIYAELKIGVHPEMYALSTLVFVFVLIFVLLFAINRRKLKQYEEVIS